VALLLFVVAAVGMMLLSPSSKVTGQATPSAKLTAYYLHNTARCVTCLAIERQAKQTIEERFVRELQNGQLAFMSVNMEESANAHFATDFDLVSQSLVLVENAGQGPVRWRVLGRVWELIGDDSAFAEYVETETRAFVAGS
jgi:hypothetical protein